MERPKLESFVSYKLITSELLDDLRKTCDDDEILCYITYRYFDKPKQDISKHYNIPLENIASNVLKVDSLVGKKTEENIAKSRVEMIVGHNKKLYDLVSILLDYFKYSEIFSSGMSTANAFFSKALLTRSVRSMLIALTI